MRKLRIFSTLVIITIFMVMLVSCASRTETVTTEAPTTEAPTTEAQAAEETETKEKFVVGYDIYWLGNAWSLQLSEEFKYAIDKEYPDIVEEVYYTSSDGDAVKQVSNFEDLVAKGCDIIFVTPQTPDNLIASIDDAMSKDIKVIVHSAAISSDNYTAYINVSDYDWGVKSAEFIAGAINGKGKVAMINGIAGSGAAKDTHDGAMSVFSEYPDITALPEVYGEWDFSKTKIVMQDLLAAHPDIAAVWTFSEPRAVVEVYKDNNLPFVPIPWHGENGEMKLWKELKDKGLKAQVIVKPSTMSVDALHIGMAALKGEPFEKDTIIPCPVYTEDDIDKLILPDLPDKIRVPTYLPEEKLKELFE